jgi:hypothetical protein
MNKVVNMKFKLNDIDYRINFRYDEGKKITSSTLEPLHFVSFVKTPIGVGSTIRNDSDKHCKETARKISLQRAIRALNLSRVDRSKVWHAYFSRKGSETLSSVVNKRNAATYFGN